MLGMTVGIAGMGGQIPKLAVEQIDRTQPAALRLDFGYDPPSYEAHLPAQQAPPLQEARLPQANVQPCRPPRAEGTSQPRPSKAQRLIMSAAASRKSRLSRAAEFDRVYRSGRSTQHRLLVLYRFDRPEDLPAAGEDGAESRVGITVSKKLGGAVERNRLKRQLREAIAATEKLDAGADYVAIARPGLPEMIERDGFEALCALVDELAAKLQPATKS